MCSVSKKWKMTYVHEIYVYGLDEEKSESARSKAAEFGIFLFDLCEDLFVGCY